MMSFDDIGVPPASVIQTGLRNNYQFNTPETDNTGENYECNIDTTLEPPQYQTTITGISMDGELLPVTTYNTYKTNIEETENTSTEEIKEKPTFKYNMFDLFWIINNKYGTDNFVFVENEAQMVTISFNINFGNLRINLYNIPRNAIHNCTVFHDRLQHLTSGTIYPSACFRMLNNNLINDKFNCIEQLIKYGETWEKERPVVAVEKSEDKIKLSIYDNVAKKMFYYIFEGHDRNVLLKACEFVTTTGFQLHGQYVLSR